jgi:ABC-type multidrug transport system permease subunit
MNKIVLQTGLLIFSLSLIYFGQRNLEFTEVLLRSFIMFVASTLVLAIITLLLIKFINNVSVKKNAEMAKNFNRK